MSGRGEVYGETVIDTWHKWGFRVGLRNAWGEKKIKKKIGTIWQTYLWAAVLASTTPAVCIQDRTGFMPLPSGSSFIVVPPLGIFS